MVGLERMLDYRGVRLQRFHLMLFSMLCTPLWFMVMERVLTGRAFSHVHRLLCKTPSKANIAHIYLEYVYTSILNSLYYVSFQYNYDEKV